MSIKKTLKRIKPIYSIIYLIRRRINAFRLARLEKNGYICGLLGRKARFYMPYINTDEIQKGIFTSWKYYENDYLDYLCDKWHGGVIRNILKEATILDIGSNIGNHTLYFLLESGANFAYCFEPAKDTFSILKKNIEINGLENRTQLYNCGVGSSSGKASISMSRDKNTAYTQLALQKEGDVSVVSIDELDIKETIGFVKIDVEGFELEVIKGMVDSLRKSKPYIMIEIWDKNYNDIVSIMAKLGYKFEVIEKRKTQGDYIFYVK